MKLYEDVKKQLKAWVLPRHQGRTYFPDGIEDPLGDEEVLTAVRRGSLIKSTDGLLYYPLKKGFLRSKTTVIRPFAVLEPIPLNSENEIPIYSSESSVDGVNIGFRIISAFQNSGGNRDISILTGAAGAPLLQLTIATNKGVSLGIGSIMFAHVPLEPIVAKWTAATVGDQHIIIQAYEQVPVEDV